MSLPGFTADASLRNRIAVSSTTTDFMLDVASIEPRLMALPGESTSLGLAAGEKCFHADHVPVCRPLGPGGALGQCCDFTHEVFCNGRRVSICTFTDCTKRPDTNAP